MAGSPIGCAAALAVLDVIAEEKLLPRCRAASHMREARAIAEHPDVAPIANVRGLGAMISSTWSHQATRGKPDGGAAKGSGARALEAGLIIQPADVRAKPCTFSCR